MARLFHKSFWQGHKEDTKDAPVEKKDEEGATKENEQDKAAPKHQSRRTFQAGEDFSVMEPMWVSEFDGRLGIALQKLYGQGRYATRRVFEMEEDLNMLHEDLLAEFDARIAGLQAELDGKVGWDCKMKLHLKFRLNSSLGT